MFDMEKCVACECSDASVDNHATYLLNLGPPFSVVRCSSCGLRWLSPMPTEAEYRSLYSEAYYAGIGSEKSDSWFADYVVDKKRSYEGDTVVERMPAFDARLNRLERIFTQRGRLLDIGAATGEFLSLARGRGWAVKGLEVSDYAAAKAKHKYGLDVHVGTLTSLPSDEKFDVIHLSHVFEHLVDPRGFLHDVMGRLDRNGVLIVEVPNQFDSWVRQFVNAIRGLYGAAQQDRNLRSVHHPYFYSSRSLQAVIRTCGYEVVECRTHFPERWGQKPYRMVLRILEFAADRIASAGDNIEVMARPSR